MAEEETEREAAARRGLEEAIREFVDASVPGSFTTDWMLLCSTISSDGAGQGQTGYMMAQNPMPYHHSLGLVMWAEGALASGPQ